MPEHLLHQAVSDAVASLVLRDDHIEDESAEHTITESMTR